MINPSMKDELWKPVVGYEGLHEVSNAGRVCCICNRKNHHYKKGDILYQRLHYRGYIRIELGKNGIGKKFAVHRLVLLAFIGPCPEGKESSHLNDIKNDNRLDNLVWMTHSENSKLAFKNGRIIPSMLGKHHSKETKKKMSAVQKICYQQRKKNSKGQFVC